MALITRVEGSGPDLVLIHGWGICSVAFESVLPFLTPFFRVHLIDLPGYGDNIDIGAEIKTIDQLVDEIHGSIPKNSCVLGWSLGGLIAMYYAVRFSADISSYITVCSSPCFCEELSEFDQHDQIWPGVERRILKAFMRLVKPKNKDEVCDHFLAMQAMGSPSIRHDIRCLRKAIAAKPKPLYEGLQFGLNLLNQLDLRESCRNLKIPSLHIFGDSDRIVSAEVAAYWNSIPSAKVVIFKKTSHNPFLSDPEEFAKVLHKFTSSLHNI
jgi:pimeloyl-[acyl-carrier protein] methyl ester esterase